MKLELKEESPLIGKESPQPPYTYLCKDGRYYNGYFGSFDHLQAMEPEMRSALTNAIKHIENELKAVISNG